MKPSANLGITPGTAMTPGLFKERLHWRDSPGAECSIQIQPSPVRDNHNVLETWAEELARMTNYAYLRYNYKVILVPVYVSMQESILLRLSMLCSPRRVALAGLEACLLYCSTNISRGATTLRASN